MQREDKAALSGLRILDLAGGQASFCTRLLADLGAGVIKIEPPGGDRSRTDGPFRGNTPHPEQSLPFWYNNAGKQGITLNLEKDEGQRLFRRLCQKTDVVVESFPPDYLDKLGLGYHTLSELNPGLIMASVTGFGQSGPYREYHSCDIVAAAMGGQMSVCGAPDTPPLKSFGQQAYYLASIFGATGILLALRQRRQSGRGQHIDISQQEAVATTLEHVMVRYFYEGIVSKRRGSRHWNDSFCVLPAKDGHILLSPFMEWETLVELLDSEGLAADLKEPKWQDEEHHHQHFDHVIQVLERWASVHTTAELLALGQFMRLPWAPVASLSEVAGSPQLKARDFFVPVAHPETGTSFLYPGAPFKLSRSPGIIQRRAPLTGEHNAEVYSRELGLSDDDLDGLASRNII